MTRCSINRLRTATITALQLILLLVSLDASAAERLAVTATLANIRASAGTDQQILWQVEKYFPVKVIQRSGEWIYFEDFEGDKGWIHDSLVGKMPSVITKTPLCNVRETPDTGSRILFKAEKGIPFKVLGRKGPWIQVEHADGDKGWVHESLVW